MAKRQTKAEKALDKEIERLYYIHAEGRSINILDISKVFAAGQAAHKVGQPIEPAVIEAVKRYTIGAS